MLLSHQARLITKEIDPRGEELLQCTLYSAEVCLTGFLLRDSVSTGSDDVDVKRRVFFVVFF